MSDVAVVLGVGVPDGVGGAVARRFADEGMLVVVAGRTQSKLDETVDWISASGGNAVAVTGDLTDASDQDRLFAAAAEKGDIKTVIYNAGNNDPIPFEQLTEDTFEQFWRICCYGAFLTAKRAIPLLNNGSGGSLLFTGASASTRGRPNFGHFASAKAALRNLAQALAREYGPQGVHVGHVVIDGIINGDNVRGRFGEYLENLGDDGALAPSDIADAFWMLHIQKKTAWSHEIDLRPLKENW